MPSQSGRRPGQMTTIEKIASKREAYHEEGNTIRAHLQDFAQTLGGLSDLPEATRLKAATKLAETMQASLEARNEVDAFVDACEAATADVKAVFDDDSAAIPDFEALISGKMATFRNNTSTDDALLKRLKKATKVLATTDDDDDDVEIDEARDVTEAELKCPITTTLFEEPVKSKKCGHVYSRAAAQAYFKTPKNCARVGCNCILAWADFERCAETELALEKLERANTQRAATQADDAMDVDDDDAE
mmetsp:Transcript_21434/g.66113  ORF Transcript_21434/g.66113 Transcript_21434/m.66113 type:complete len:247 (+) Transcript_21434:50-790(+)